MNLKKYNFQHGKLGVDPRLKLTNDPSRPKLSNYHSFFLSNEVFFPNKHTINWQKNME